MATRVRKALNDPSRFEGNGISYKAKLIGIEDVKDARGDAMCQEALVKLKNSVKISGEHKRKIFINVTLEGLKIIDAISLIVLHSHAVHRISFISRDTTDSRAFGYVYGTEDGLHKFFAIKTAAAAEHLVLALRDLFQVVYELKKKEMELAKEKLEKGEPASENLAKENSQSSGEGSTSGNAQTPAPKAAADAENIYQVPTNNAPVNPVTQAEQVANLLDLEDQADHILKGIEQIKNLELDDFTSDSLSSPSSTATSPLAKSASPPAVSTTTDPWGLSATSTAAAASSALEELAGLQTGSFATGGQQPFGSSNFAAQSGFGSSSGFSALTGGLPVSNDPFGNDPFGSTAHQPRIPAAPGFGAANPFSSGFNQPYGMAPRMGIMGVHGMMPGMVPHGMMSSPIMGGLRGPFGLQQPQGLQMGNPFGDDSNVLQPIKKDGGADSNAGSTEAVKARPKSPRDDLFGDLLEIKKSSPAKARSPKEMFAQINAPDRKPMKEMKGPGKPAESSPTPAQASVATSDPFGDQDSVGLDKTRGLLLSDSGEEDPFDTSHIPPSLTELSNHENFAKLPVSSTYPENFAKSSLASNSPENVTKSSISSTSSENFAKSPVTSTVPPPVPLRHPSSTQKANISSSFSMPSSPPPPPPPPITLPSQLTPPVPSRTLAKSEVIKDVNEKPGLHPSQFFVSDTSYISYMHPLPDEPPPPLPRYIACQTSSPPVTPSLPRPNSQSSPQFPQVHKDLHVSGSVSEESDLSDMASPSQDFKKAVIDVCSDQASAISICQDHKDSVNSEAKCCDIMSKSDTQVASSHCLDDCNHFCAVSAPEDGNSSRQNGRSKSGKASWVGFDNSENFAENRSSFPLPAAVSTSDKSDPFQVPLHLTPGFKAEAKFGSDPFDDSYSAPFSDVWDPFAAGDNAFNQESHTSLMNSPFGDAFIAPVQQVADKPLFD